MERDQVDIGALVSELDAGLLAGAGLQAAYDAIGWRISEPAMAKARHLMYHTLRAITELAVIVEAAEHSEESGNTMSNDEFQAVISENSQIVGALLMHAFQIANLGGYSASEAYRTVLAKSARRFAPDSGFVNIA